MNYKQKAQPENFKGVQK